MSGFENYPEEIASLDHEIRHYAAVCGVPLSSPREIEAFLHGPHAPRPGDDSSRETLRGLLILRIKVETEMIEHGLKPPPFNPAP